MGYTPAPKLDSRFIGGTLTRTSHGSAGILRSEPRASVFQRSKRVLASSDEVQNPRTRFVCWKTPARGSERGAPDPANKKGKRHEEQRFFWAE